MEQTLTTSGVILTVIGTLFGMWLLLRFIWKRVEKGDKLIPIDWLNKGVKK